MKRAIVGLLVLWAGLTFAPMAMADPVASLSATAPTQYENGDPIPVSDVLTYKVYCGTADGGGYPYSFDAPNLDPGTSIDIAACVQGQPGTYYFVSTATSTTHSTESVFSNQTSRVYTANDLGKVPGAPTLFTIQ